MQECRGGGGQACRSAEEERVRQAGVQRRRGSGRQECRGGEGQAGRSAEVGRLSSPDLLTF